MTIQKQRIYDLRQLLEGRGGCGGGGSVGGGGNHYQCKWPYKSGRGGRGARGG